MKTEKHYMQNTQLICSVVFSYTCYIASRNCLLLATKFKVTLNLKCVNSWRVLFWG